MSARPPFKRIAVTRPPDDWFHGISRAIFEICRQGFVDLGLEVFEVPIDLFLYPDVGRISALLSDLRAFQPDVACGLTHGLHAMVCRMPEGRDGYRANLFTEVLDIPTICYWDHAPLDLADQLLQPHPKSPGESAAGAMETLRRTLTHPRLIHWSRDSGQSRIMRELGFLRPDRVLHELPACLPGFSMREAPVEAGAGFVGHFYKANDPNPDYACLSRETIDGWLAGQGSALWDVLLERVAEMDAGESRRLALDPDQTMFWGYAHGLIVQRAQSAARLKVLGAAGVPVMCYGDLPVGRPGSPRNLVARLGPIPFGASLAEALSRHEITIDVMNPGFVHGYSFKPILGFVSGGFMLIDRKRDFVEAFGDAGEAASYDGAEALGAKVELFLGNSGYRREVGDAIRETIARRFLLKDVLRRVLEGAAERSDPGGGVGKPARNITDKWEAVPVMDLLPWFRSDGCWKNARVEVLDGEAFVNTSAEAWSYAAAFWIPEVKTRREPHVRMRILVEKGRFGIGGMRDGIWDLRAEQFVGPTAEAITVTVELPHEGVSNVVLRNASEGVSRARVLEASLYDRV
jgi:hypothetical protein